MSNTVETSLQQPQTATENHGAGAPPATRRRLQRIPSKRDFEIFRLAEIVGLTHAEIALSSTTLTRRRVSQIIEKVRRWLSQNPCDDPRLATELERKCLTQNLERMHLLNIIDKARDALTFAPQELATTTVRPDGGKTVTSRQQPFNVQILKTYLRAVDSLGRMNQRPETPLCPPAESEHPWARAALSDVEERWDKKIWAGKLKPEDLYAFADDVLAAFLKAMTHQQLLAEQAQANAADQAELDGALQQGQAPAEFSSAGDQEGEAPAEPALARSASQGNVVSSTDDSDSPATSLSTAYSVPSTDSSQLAEDPNQKFKIQNPKFISRASQTSQAEAVVYDEDAAEVEALTCSDTNTSALPSAPKTAPPAASPSQENPKREARPTPVP